MGDAHPKEIVIESVRIWSGQNMEDVRGLGILSVTAIRNVNCERQ